MTAPVYNNFCKWSSTTAGTGPFTIGAAAPTDDAGPHDTPANCGAVTSTSYKYFAWTPTQSEAGRGVYSSGSNTLTRAEIYVNSDGTLTAVNFTSTPIVDVFPNPLTDLSGVTFTSTTRLTFQQSTAPQGWTKVTTFNDVALRVVNGTAGSGGVNTFSFTFSYRTDDATTLSTAQMPSHAHTDNIAIAAPGFSGGLAWDPGSTNQVTPSGVAGNPTGGGGSHQHTYDMRVLYVDVIIASKN